MYVAVPKAFSTLPTALRRQVFFLVSVAHEAAGGAFHAGTPCALGQDNDRVLTLTALTILGHSSSHKPQKLLLEQSY